MPITNRPTRIAATGAAAIGLLLGVGAVAGAVTAPTTTPDTAPADDQDTTVEPMLDGSVHAPEGPESESEADEAAALEGLATITAADAEQAALTAAPGGTVEEVELGNENGSVVYEVEVVADDGIETEVKIDAGNGDVLAIDDESGDDESGEATETVPAG